MLIEKFSSFAVNKSSIFVIDPTKFYHILIVLVIMLMIHFFERNKNNITAVMKNWKTPVRWVAYSIMIWAIFLFGNFTKQEFIYFTF